MEPSIIVTLKFCLDVYYCHKYRHYESVNELKSYLAGWGTVMLVGIIIAVIYVIVYFTTLASFSQ